MRLLNIAVFLSASLATTAQVRPPIGILPHPSQVFPEITAYLNLSDGQVTSLMNVTQRRQEAEGQIYRQIGEKERALYELVKAGSRDAARIGQLYIDINELRGKLPLNKEPWRGEALNVLTPEQRNKLPGLVDAMRLQNPAWQAVHLNLLDNPNGDANILPAAPPFFSRMNAEPAPAISSQ